jgi:hypothetical protein
MKGKRFPEEKAKEEALDAPGAADTRRKTHAALVARFRNGLPGLRSLVSLVQQRR